MLLQINTVWLLLAHFLGVRGAHLVSEVRMMGTVTSASPRRRSDGAWRGVNFLSEWQRRREPWERHPEVTWALGLLGPNPWFPADSGICVDALV